METGERSFTINNAMHVDGCPTKFAHKDFSGRYISREPVGAAKKALTQLCNLKKIKGACALYIEVRETTQGSAGKVFRYKVTRKKLDVPRKISADRPPVMYENVAKSVDSVPVCGKSRKSSGPMRSISRRSLKSRK